MIVCLCNCVTTTEIIRELEKNPDIDFQDLCQNLGMCNQCMACQCHIEQLQMEARDVDNKSDS